MSELREQLIDCLHDRDFDTFDKLVVDLQAADAVSVVQIAYKVKHIEGFKQLVLQHPERNYSLVLQQLIACKDTTSLGLWLLESAPRTTIGQWDYKSYNDLKEKVDPQLYTAMIERQAQYLEPRFLMASARYHQREDFAQHAVQKLENFPLRHDQLEEYEREFLESLLLFNSLPLMEEMFARCSHRIVLHALTMEICSSYHPKNHLEILEEVLERYTPTAIQLDGLNASIQRLIEYQGSDMVVARFLMPYYNPHFQDGETFFLATYLDSEDDFLMFLEATPLDVQKEVFVRLSEPRVNNKPSHFGLLKTRIDDQELRLKLQEELQDTPHINKTRLM